MFCKPLSGHKATDRGWKIITLSAVTDSDRGAVCIAENGQDKPSHVGGALRYSL